MKNNKHSTRKSSAMERISCSPRLKQLSRGDKRCRRILARKVKPTKCVPILVTKEKPPCGTSPAMSHASAKTARSVKAKNNARQMVIDTILPLKTFKCRRTIRPTPHRVTWCLGLKRRRAVALPIAPWTSSILAFSIMSCRS